MNTSARHGLFSWFTFWIALAILFCYMLWPLRKTLRYGIDLVGGSYITLEVQTQKAIETELLSKLQSISNRLKEANKSNTFNPSPFIIEISKKCLNCKEKEKLI